MVNYRFNLCKSPSVFMRCSQRESSNIKDKRSLNSKIHLAVDVSINFIVTGRLCADYKEAIYLTKNINTKLVFADHDYDTNEILSYFNQRNIKPVTPQKRNRLYQRGYKAFKEKRQQSHRKLYCSRHIIENAFLALKRLRGISTHYAKTLGAFIVAIFVCCIFLLF